jgi:phosphopantothenoylcysteine decarboxylase / phosphopantothenate---cysteine ligase
MPNLAGKKILLGVSGSIAAYKAAELVRRLQDSGATVRVVMTAAATAFITPLTLQALSGYPVSQDLLDPAAEAAMAHIALAKWADLVLIAPATAAVLARLACGIADDLLTTLCLATTAPIAVAPAMNQQMYQAAATQHNLRILAQQGVALLGPEEGSQACGDQGLGRLLETAALVAEVEQLLTPRNDLQGMRWLLTAGPTQEALDPVRFISNHSSGKMGFAVAQAAAARGAVVTLISGPVLLATPPGVHRIAVTSAVEMSAAVMERVQQQDLFVACAAVANYRPQRCALHKLKSHEPIRTLTLVKNPDIVAQVAQLKEQRPYTVGFAAETEQLTQSALTKLREKHLDLICANDISCVDQGFHSDTNALHLYWSEGEKSLPLTSKSLLAHHLIDEIIQLYYANYRP